MSPDSASAAAVLDALAVGIRVRVAAQRRAEERLADFVFREGPPMGEAPTTAQASNADPSSAAAQAAAAQAAAAQGRDRALGPGSTDWHFYVVAALRAGTDPAAIAVLEALRQGPASLAQLAEASRTSDPAATADLVGALAGAGLVVRDLERAAVRLSALGEAILVLVDELAQRAAGDQSASGDRSAP
jgi:DNA-binding transcriptional ArsR family regulator